MRLQEWNIVEKTLDSHGTALCARLQGEMVAIALEKPIGKNVYFKL